VLGVLKSWASEKKLPHVNGMYHELKEYSLKQGYGKSVAFSFP
jgi:hypothetical protein